MRIEKVFAQNVLHAVEVFCIVHMPVDVNLAVCYFETFRLFLFAQRYAEREGDFSSRSYSGDDNVVVFGENHFAFFRVHQKPHRACFHKWSAASVGHLVVSRKKHSHRVARPA